MMEDVLRHDEIEARILKFEASGILNAEMQPVVFWMYLPCTLDLFGIKIRPLYVHVVRFSQIGGDKSDSTAEFQYIVNGIDVQLRQSHANFFDVALGFSLAIDQSLFQSSHLHRYPPTSNANFFCKRPQLLKKDQLSVYSEDFHRIRFDEPGSII